MVVGLLVGLLIAAGVARADAPKPTTPPTPTPGPPPPPAAALPPKPVPPAAAAPAATPAPPAQPPAVAPPRSATPPPAPSETLPTPPTPPPPAPKPAPELAELKPLEGNWRCEGTMPAGPFGPEQGWRSTFKVKKDLDGFWYALEYEQRKSKQHPSPTTAHGLLGYDTAAKKFVATGADSMGGWATQISPGWTGDKLVFTGDLSLAGQRLPFRETYTRKGERELISVVELKMGKDWIALGTDICRR
jgi:hypothetical protein